MPKQAPRPCLIPGCGSLREDGGYCSFHASVKEKERSRREKERGRPSTIERGYDKNHVRLRAYMKSKYPICATPGCYKHSVDLDHIDGNTRNLEESNLQMLCSSCHSIKSVREQGAGWKK
ncbi:MAG: HNH endonuclease signature motif containing protein [Thermodesulfobacteriota bacterium]